MLTRELIHMYLHQTFIAEDDITPFGGDLSPLLGAKNIVPPIGVKAINDTGRSQNILHLRSSHTQLQLSDVLIGKYGSLRYFNAINAG